MKIHFDHSYCADHNYRFFKRLERSGFKLSKQMEEHPGKHFCRFIFFDLAPLPGFRYLEFIHVKKGGELVRKPGMSFASTSPLKPFHAKLKKKGLVSEYKHKNYNWKQNSTDNLPGWNFITFKRRSNIFTWLTEYESVNEKPHPVFKIKHPNKAHKIVAFEIVFTKEELSFYTKVLGSPKNNVFILACGTEIHYSVGKAPRLKRIIVGTTNLSRFVKKYPWDELTTWKNQPGATIKNPNPKMWDLTIVEQRIESSLMRAGKKRL